MVVGLGNPGPRYERTRHNAGFHIVGALAAAHGIGLRQERHGALVGDGEIEGCRCLLALPQTFMNRSGDSVRRLLAFTGLGLGELVVVHDDIDLPFGRLRLRLGGGSGGQRGVASIIEQLGTPGFVRLKVGVSRPPPPVPVEAWVLQEFNSVEREALGEIAARGCSAIETLVARGLPAAMNACNPGAAGGGP